MLQIRLGHDRETDPTTDPLGRSRVGSYPGISERDAWTAGRGVWKMKADRVLSEDEVQIIDKEGIILAVAEITGLSKYGDRQAVEGTLLLGDQRVGTRTPHPTTSQNPVSYY